MTSKRQRPIKKRTIIVGKRLREWRGKQGSTVDRWLTLVKLEGITGISQGTLSDIENGLSLPSANTLIAFHEKTNLNIIYLLTGEGRKQKR